MAKKYGDLELKQCPIIYAMNIIGSKWKMPILWNLTKHKELHYNELKRKIFNITNTMLTRSLRELEANGLIIRTSAESIPPSVVYSLTNLGKELIPSLNGLYEWGERHQNSVEIK